mmetsp:Transcript_5062/g.10273  ORF Transcript_5062/g.10273 Transcript_5062/m.10273 type:complete len:90 (-) Transcript_5062:2093-2362(-)
MSPCTASQPRITSRFDVVTNCVSVDYLTRPLEVFQEIRRVLRPSGIAIMSFSNRCFPSKAINLWLNTSDWVRFQKEQDRREATFYEWYR